MALKRPHSTREAYQGKPFHNQDASTKKALFVVAAHLTSFNRSKCLVQRGSWYSHTGEECVLGSLVAIHLMAFMAAGMQSWTSWSDLMLCIPEHRPGFFSLKCILLLLTSHEVGLLIIVLEAGWGWLWYTFYYFYDAFIVNCFEGLCSWNETINLTRWMKLWVSQGHQMS